MLYRYSRTALAIVFTLPFALACSGRGRPVAHERPPLADEPTDGPQTASENVSSETTPAPSVEDVLNDAGQRRARGETLLRNGLVPAARSEFENALELLRGLAGSDHASDARIAREIDELAAHLEGMEAERRTETAIIDDLAELDIFGPPDPRLRKRAEEEFESLNSDLPIELNDRVLSMLEYFTEGAGRAAIEDGLTRAGLYRPMIERIFSDVGIPLDLIHLAQAESAFKPAAISRAGARGMWQFIPARGQEYGLRRNEWIDERSDPEKSTWAAARHLKDLHDQFGDWYLAMAAYNSGPGRVARAMEQADSSDFWTLSEQRLLPRETRNFVPTILAMTVIGKDLARYGFDIEPADALDVERVTVDRATDLRIVADRLDLPLARIRELNPQILRWATPPGIRDFELILPRGFGDAFEDKIAGLPENERILFHHHVVESGETVSRLAQRYDVSIDAIGEANNLSDRYTIRLGQSLIIPVSGIVNRESGAAYTEPATDRRPSSYRIRSGDTLSEIADRFGLEVADIRRWNQMTSNLLIAGDNLTLTPPTMQDGERALVYNVQRGDTLFEIASLYRISIDEIRSWNLDSDLSIIRPGDRLRIFPKY